MVEPIAEIADVVRTAVAPVFLLSGVGVTLTMLTGRLARVVDRINREGKDATITHGHQLSPRGTDRSPKNRH